MTNNIGIVFITAVTALFVCGLFVSFTPRAGHASRAFEPCVWPNRCMAITAPCPLGVVCNRA